jgi:hypothetical protein
MSKPAKSVKKSSPPPSKAKEAPGTKAPVKRDDTLDDVLTAPKRPTRGPFNAPAKFLVEMPGHQLVEATPAPSSVRAVNTGTGTGKAVPPKKGKK